ncbi:transaldolase [Hymenobacter defluvii]|uniref:Transaldolase n=1 Tax=Hymenobacter defluvii TaxID=2054411 RepID=A0ABS3TKU2_9BACT|nr:transaldolase [Hymenobacter defluvii]MBO3273330.1 transaldolase [Hymenobacter defluvii]
MNPLVDIRRLDQSVWLDFISRQVLTNGELKRRIAEDALRGVTSNPAIFEKAIGGSADYDDTIREQALQGKSAEEIYQGLVVADVQAACDLFRELFESHDNSSDGYVSLEVSPELADDTEGTLAEARQLWQAVDRPNVMIKVPATPAGIPAIRTLISEGLNINVTLIFGLDQYQAVAEAFIAGLEDRAQAGHSLTNSNSVASFFLSRIDVLIDPMLEQLAADGGERGLLAGSLVGEVAIACAKQAYQRYKEIFAGPRWEALVAKEANTQRLLWASTGNKNPKYDDLKYVENLIGPRTVNTVPVETMDIFKQKGRPAARLEENTDHARQVLADLPKLDLDLDKLTQQLEKEGVQKFKEPFAKMLASVEQKRQQALAAD